MKIILASQSPRRKELLERVGFDFEIIVSDADENIKESNPGRFVEQLSRRKADAVVPQIVSRMDGEDYLIIGSDTVVVQEDSILGKPKDEEDAVRMLLSLSGRQHSVYTGVTLLRVRNGVVDESGSQTFSEETKVFMYDISESEAREYVQGKEPMDKAGAYAIQGQGERFIRSIEGSFSNVVGLPAARVYQIIKNM